MTKRYFSTLLILLLALSALMAKAQHASYCVGTQAGLAVPLGQFSSKDYSNGGYALSGTSYGLEGAWFWNGKWGIGVDVSASSFAFSATDYVSAYKASEPAFTDVQMLSGPYIVRTYLGGAYYKVGICPEVGITFKAMAGLTRAWTPDQLFGVNSSEVGKLYFWKTRAYSAKMAVLCGANIEYKLFERVSLLLQTDFSYSEMAFVFAQGTAPNTVYNTKFLQLPVFNVQPGINVNF